MIFNKSVAKLFLKQIIAKISFKFICLQNLLIIRLETLGSMLN